MIARLVAHDWQGFEQLFAEDFHISDRRRVVQLELDRSQYVAFTREVSDGRTIRGHSEVIATRGDRLALNRSTYEFTDADVGPSEIAFLILTEVDDRGRIASYVRWDIDDLDAAYAELETRWEVGEAGEHPLASRWILDYQRCFAARDWDGMAAIMAPDLVSQSHRLVSWGTLHGPQGLVSTMQVQMELAPDTQLRGDHIRTCTSGLLMEYAWYGTREGGAFENLLIAAIELDTTGRARRVDVWEEEQGEQAWARFEEIGTAGGSKPPAESKEAHRGGSEQRMQPLQWALGDSAGEFDSPAALRDRRSTGPAPFANAATRAWSKLYAAWQDRDWQRFASLRAADFRFFDRTPVAQLELDGAQHLEYIRSLGEMNVVRSTQYVLATRGDRLALGRSRIEVAGGEVGPSEIVSLFLTETNACGEVQAFVRFEGDALDAAYGELDERFDADEAAAHRDASDWSRAFRRLFASRDWDALIELSAPALVAHDHRLAGWGTQRAPVAWVQALRSLVDLAPDVRTRIDHVRMSDRGFLTAAVQWGTRDGGAFEIPVTGVFELGEQGKLHRLDLYDPGQLDQARARFGAIGAITAPDPLRIPPNASTRANDRWWAYAEAEDWDAVRALTAGMVFEDRRRLIRIAGGAELLLADTRHLREVGWRPTRTLLATAGDRLSLERMLWTMEDGGQVSEIEVLKVAEIDAEGRIVAYIIFDADDRRGASTDLLERAARSGADELPATWFEFWRAWNAHDLGRLRALLPADYFFCDYRHTGIGRVEGEAYIASLAALYELSPDVWLEPLYWVARAAHGGVGVMRWVGTNAEGGEFEAIFAGISLYRGERPVGAELFEIADLDAALARFEELGAAR